MDSLIFIKGQALISALCWTIVCVGAGIAVFSKRINDTVSERIGLSLIVIFSAAAAWRAWVFGWVTNTGFLISIAFAFYVCAVFWKHWKRLPGHAGDKR